LTRLLVVNVNFAPASYGGATIVAENMASAIANEQGWQVLVVTSFYDSSIVPYSMKRYAIRGVDVIAVCIPRHGLSFEQGYTNSEFDAVMARVLDSYRPDIAHIHCVQTMGASFMSELAKRKIPMA